MADEVEGVKSGLAALRADIFERLDTMNGDLRELTKAMRDFVRIETDQKRIEGNIDRIGGELVNSEQRTRERLDDHEERLRRLEHSDALQAKSVGIVDWLVQNSLGLLVGAVVAGTVIKAAGV